LNSYVVGYISICAVLQLIKQKNAVNFKWHS